MCVFVVAIFVYLSVCVCVRACVCTSAPVWMQGSGRDRVKYVMHSLIRLCTGVMFNV